MSIRKLSNSGIPFGNTAGRPASPSTGQPYFNGELQRLELYTGATYGWQNIVAETPGVTGYTGTVIETNSTNTITITGTNFSSGATATLIGTDGTEYNSTSTTINNLTSITATFGAIAADKEPYDIRVTNPSNLYGVYYDILTVNDKPIWSTAAGSLGSFPQGSVVSYQFSATDEESNALTYALVSGSLPTGLSLSSSGLISGTNSGTINTTYNFTVSISDGLNTAQSRAFSMLTTYPTVSGGTLTSDATYYYRTFTGNGTLTLSGSINGDILIVAGGGAGGSSPSGSAFTGPGGGGAGAILYKTSHPIPHGNTSITVGAGGSPVSSISAQGGSNGQDSSFGDVIAIGGGGGANAVDRKSFTGKNGGSGGGGANGEPSGSDYGSAHYTGAENTGQLGGSSTQSTITGWTKYGNSGGPGAGDNSYNVHAGGGGGGAGAAGNITRTAHHLRAGDGGIGLNTWSSWASVTNTGSSGYYAAGGGGGTYTWSGDPSMTETSWGSNYPNYIGRGGTGGGGNGGAGSGTVNPTAATQYTGSGGGGGGYNLSGASGGSGVVIVRYTKASVGG